MRYAMTSSTKPPQGPLPGPADLGPGFETCPSCAGERVCWLCRGAGVLSSGQLCRECMGRRYCIGCDAAGVIPTVAR